MGAKIETAEIVKPELSYIVAPALSGKTTLSGSYIADPDDARDDAIEAQLKPLRKKGMWPEHNAIWHSVLKKWVVQLPEHVYIVFAHSLEDAKAMASARPGALARLEVPLGTWLLRAIRLAATDPERVEIALLNRGSLMHNPDYLNLPHWDTWNEKGNVP